MAEQLTEQEVYRRQSLQKIREMGIEPFPAAAYSVNAHSKEIIASFKDDEGGEPRQVCIAGRVMGNLD